MSKFYYLPLNKGITFQLNKPGYISPRKASFVPNNNVKINFDKKSSLELKKGGQLHLSCSMWALSFSV